VRYWKYGDEDKSFYPQPLHCGLAPKVFYTKGMRVPYYIRHYGLIDRKAKIARYDKYDKDAKYKGRAYYDELRGGDTKAFVHKDIKKMVEEFVEKYRERLHKPMEEKKQEKVFFVRNRHGAIVPIPERHLKETLRRGGYELIGENVVKNNAEVANVFDEGKVIVGDELLKQKKDVRSNIECEICEFKAKTPNGLRAHKVKHQK
jgi:hypothetical protein